MNSITPSPHKERASGTQAVTLALVAGFLDGYAYLTFKTYVSFMSGNTTFAGLKSGEAQFSAALLSGAAIAGFLGGSFAGNWFVGLKTAYSNYSKRLLFGGAALLLTVFTGLSLYGLQLPVLGVSLLSFAMGLVNPALSRIGAESVSLTFVTGTLNKIGTHLALAARRAVPSDAQGPWDTHLFRARVEASLWAGFFGGAVLSGVAAPHFGVYTLLFPLAALLFFALMDRAGTAAHSSR